MTDNVQPIFILPEDSKRNSGKTAQSNNILAAKAVAETVRTTLGPKGMDKMLVDSFGNITVTNDGVTILEEMSIEHPTAKMIVEIAKTQETEVGDGTTTAVVLAGELLSKAESLLNSKIHPTVIIKGYRLAAKKAQEVLNRIAEKITLQDKKELLRIAETAMTGKGAENTKEILGKICVDAVTSIAENNRIDKENIKIEKKAGDSVLDSRLVKGIVLDKEKAHSSMPSFIEKAKILLLECPIEVKETETEAKISINTPSQLKDFLDMEESMIKDMCSKITESGANVVFCQKGIDDIALHLLSKAGILAVKRVPKSDMEKIAKATSSEILTSLDSIPKNSLGYAGLVEEKTIGEDKMVFIENCRDPKAVTILIRGGTEHIIDEIKRAVEDAIGDLVSAIESERIVAGAGACEMELGKELIKYSQKFSGREQLSIKAFAESLEVIPRTLAENAGLDPINALTELKSAHEHNNKWAGLNVFTGKIMNSWKQGILEPLKIKTQAIESASEVATMILRIDDVILASKNSPEQPSLPN